nr:DUF4283 domain-containing protein [Ipomoea batatas]
MAGEEFSEATVSKTLGSTDTVPEDNGTVGESLGPQVQNLDKGKNKTPWVDLFKPNCDRKKDVLQLEFFEPVNGGAVIQDNELLVFKEQWAFALLGCFAGRFPGIIAIQALVDSWKIPCKWFTQPNDHVLFRFNTEEDRCKILQKEHSLYGKPLFLKTLPERFHLENNDFSTLPIWVQFPSLPTEFWGAVALSKIASCIGKPLSSDEKTKTLKKGGYARVLVEIDTSFHPLEAIPRGKKANQPKNNRGRSRRARSKARSKVGRGVNANKPSIPSPPNEIQEIPPPTSVLEETTPIDPCHTATTYEVEEIDTTVGEATEHALDTNESTLEGNEKLAQVVGSPEPSSPIDKGSELNNVASPLGSNTSRGRNVLQEIIAEVFEETTAAKKKKKGSKAVGTGNFVGANADGASKNSNGTMGYKAALLSPSTSKGNQSNAESQSTRNLTLLPLRDKTMARGGGRRKPTLVVK